MNLSHYRSSLRYRFYLFIYLLTYYCPLYETFSQAWFESVWFCVFLLRSKCEFNIQAVNNQGRYVLTSPYWPFASIFISWHSSFRFSLCYLKNNHSYDSFLTPSSKYVISDIKSLLFNFQDHSSDWWRKPLCRKNGMLGKHIIVCLTKG